MNQQLESFSHKLVRDIISSIVVFLVALPLCLGIAIASNAPPFSGLLAGIIGGIVVGILSGSHTSVSGPAAGLTAVVAAQITELGSFEAFLLAVLLAGIFQVILGICRLGIIAEFIPSSVIKGLLAAIGVIIIIKQLPQAMGFDSKMKLSTLIERHSLEMFNEAYLGVALLGIFSVIFLEIWGHTKSLKKSIVPPQLLVVLLGIAAFMLFPLVSSKLVIPPEFLVQVPVIDDMQEFGLNLKFPDFSQLKKEMIYMSALTIALVASIETLLNIEAVDKIDPQKRSTPPSRELIAQGIGNIFCGLLGALPVTSVIVRSSANLQAGGRTKLACILHGCLLLICILTIPMWLNKIPLASLAAILVVTGYKLVNPQIIVANFNKGYMQFIPFAVTVIAIVATDLLDGVLIGLGVSIFFILYRNMSIPLDIRVEQNQSEDSVTTIVLPDQVSFLNRAVLVKALHQVPRGGNVILDASNTHYIDPDIIDLIRDFHLETDPPYDVHVQLQGFDGRFGLHVT